MAGGWWLVARGWADRAEEAEERESSRPEPGDAWRAAQPGARGPRAEARVAAARSQVAASKLPSHKQVLLRTDSWRQTFQIS